jgi:hypothetical protein
VRQPAAVSGTVRSRATASGSGSATGRGNAGPSCLAAAQKHKAAGNALFKSGSYRAAADRYQQGVQELTSGLASGSNAELSQLLVDLSNNTALALIRMAEEWPPGS